MDTAQDDHTGQQRENKGQEPRTGHTKEEEHDMRESKLSFMPEECSLHTHTRFMPQTNYRGQQSLLNFYIGKVCCLFLQKILRVQICKTEKSTSLGRAFQVYGFNG